MKGGVVTKLHLIVFLPSILVFWDDKGTLAGSVPQMQDSNQFPKFLVLKKPGGKKSLIEIEGKTGRKELVQKQTGRHKIESRDYSRKAKRQCKDVTFGECTISNDKIFRTFKNISKSEIHSNISMIETCQNACVGTDYCGQYRFNHQTQECTLMTGGDYMSLCKIRAGPMDIQMSSCLMSRNPCDWHTEEDCEYTGNVVRMYRPGVITDDDVCQEECQNLAPTCKYWIYNIIERACILKGEGTRICNVYGGPKRSLQECQDFLEDHEK